MKLTPRDYQQESVNSIYEYFSKATGNPVVALPTGTGKSVVIAAFLEGVYKQYPDQKILVLTHVKELIKQNFDKLKELWPQAPAGVNSAGLGKRDYRHPIVFAGIGSVAKKPHLFGTVDLILVDECHLISPAANTMYRQFIDELLVINPCLKVVGFTATPWRLGQGRITENGLFTDLCIDLTTMTAFNRFIEEGYLVPLVPKPMQTMLDVEGVHTRGGEFIAKELQLAVDQHDITERALREAMEVGEDRASWLIFASGVDHAVHIAEALSTFGIPCEAVHGALPKGERDRILADFKSGRLRAVANNNVLTTGFDHPGIDMIVMLRPTASPVLWVQMLGRGTRPLYADGFDLTTQQGRRSAIEYSQKRTCLVLDFAGNTKRLGPVNDPQIPRRPGKGGGEAPVKECDVCGMYNHASVRICANPDCGAEFKFEVKIKQGASSDALIKDDLPVVEVFDVDHVTYQQHIKQGMPPSMRVTYYCQLRKFDDFVCVQHERFAKEKAKRWWAERTDLPFPDTTAEAIKLCERWEVALPTQLRVWTNKKYPEILAYCYDGTGFGAHEPNSSTPSREVTVPRQPGEPEFQRATDSFDGFDDEIPF